MEYPIILRCGMNPLRTLSKSDTGFLSAKSIYYTYLNRPNSRKLAQIVIVNAYKIGYDGRLD